MPIILIGMPGSGKTTVGRALALRLQLPFRDCDEEIVKRIKISIPQYFARYGEAGFRQKETEVITDLKDYSGVFSLGGGALTQAVNQQQLIGRTLVYLESSISSIVARIGSKSGRPLLDGTCDLATKLELLEVQRKTVFETLATLRIQVDGLSIEEINTEIIRQLKI